MGRPSILNKKLVHKIAQKTGKPDLSIVKSISALASRRTISPEVALVITAKKWHIGSAIVFKKLKPDQSMQLTTELNKNLRRKGVSSDSNFRKKIKKLKLNIRAEFADPYLQDSLYLNIPSEGYSIMFALENSIRVFITRILSDNFEEKWWDEVQKKNKLKEMIKKVVDRKTKDSKNWYCSKRGVHEIYYTDYSELLHIIRTFDSIFSKFFKKGATKNLIGKLGELIPTRNVIAHSNPITTKDLDRLRVHARDWFAYMQYLKLQEF